jgi:hypothetical protein
VVGRPRGLVARPLADGDRRGEVDDGVVAGDGRHHRVVVEEVHFHWPGAAGDQVGARVGATHDPGHVEAGGDQPSDRPAADHAGRTGDEDLHPLLLSLRTDVMVTSERRPA